MKIKVPDFIVLEAAIMEYDRSHPTEGPCEECLELGKAMAFSRTFVAQQRAWFSYQLLLAEEFRAGTVSREELEQHQIMMMKMSFSYGLYAAALLERDDGQ